MAGWCWCVVWLGAVVAATQAQPRVMTLEARDTLAVSMEGASEDARAMLEDLAYAPGVFTVTCVAETGDVTVRFPSPRPRFPRDQVVMEWHVARDGNGQPLDAPGVLVVHTIHPDTPIGRAVARGLAARGFHAFMMFMPGFGPRWRPGDDAANALFPRLRQAVADARRARDAITVLPRVTPGKVALQGTSLGGIVAANAAALDGAFDPVLLVITGGNLKTIVEQGNADAAFVRWRLEDGGISGDRLHQLCQALEPTRIAHRLDPQRTWLFSAENDVVIPPACAEALAKAIRLPKPHHLKLPGNHYTVLTRFPAVVEEMARLLRQAKEVGQAASDRFAP